MSKLFFVLACVIIISCATSRPVMGPDGTENQLIACPAAELCYDKAHEICHGPYKIINTSSETSGMNGSTGTTIKMLVKCGQYTAQKARSDFPY